MELTETDIMKWTTVVMEVNASENPVGYRRTSECMNDLTSVLDQLYNFLVIEMKNPVKLLHSMPSLPKFLSALCCNSYFLCNEILYKRLMSCILSFYKNLASQRSVTEWTMSQLKQTISADPHFNSSIHTAVSDFVGMSSYSCSQELAINLITSIQTELQSLPSLQWDKETRSVLPLYVLPGKVLREISELCLPIIHSSNATDLVESLLCCQISGDILEKESISEQSSVQAQYAQSLGLSPLFFEAVSKTQRNGYKKTKTGVINLSYDALVCLWLQHLPSFESELINLIDACVDELDSVTEDTFTKELINSRHLPKACSSHVQLQCVANSLLSQFLIKCGEYGWVQKFISCFVECLKENSENSKKETFLMLN